MSWRVEKTKQGSDLVWDSPELGIAPSALKGNANLQNVNIATQSGQVMASFGRISQTPLNAQAATLTPVSSTLFTSSNPLKAGVWLQVTASTVTSINVSTFPTSLTVNYLVVAAGGAGGVAQNGGGAGGSAGEVKTSTQAMAVGAYTVTVGIGNSSGSITPSNGDGNPSSIVGGAVSIIAAKGLGGGTWANRNGQNGVLGSGAAGTTGGGGTGGTGSSFAGGNGFSGTATSSSGGSGAGAGGAGNNGVANQGGAGGAHTTTSISGSSKRYAEGGGGGSGNASGGGTASSGGSGGGDAVGGTPSVAGGEWYGSGGGGGGSNDGSSIDGGAGAQGVVVISYPTGSAVCTGGTITQVGGNTIHTFTTSGSFAVVSVKPVNLYYVSSVDGSGNIKLSSQYDPYGNFVVTHGTTGTVAFNVYGVPSKAIAKATEKYNTSSSTEYRYYILDDNGLVWVYDTQVYDFTLAAYTVGVTWQLPDPVTTSITGIGVLNGWLMGISPQIIFCKPTEVLGVTYMSMHEGFTMNPFDLERKHAINTSQGTLIYTDGNFIGEVFPTTSLVTSVANVQSYAAYTAVTTIGTVSKIIGGSLPVNTDGTRMPVVFFTSQGGSLPTAISPDTVYYVDYSNEADTFQVWTALTGGSNKDMQTGATGTQYFNTFYPVGSDAGSNGSHPLVQFTNQRVNLPFYESSKVLLEIGNTILIGCRGSKVYPWNQQDATPSDVIAIPESDVVAMVNANNTAYILAGNKGNIYITNNVVASLALKVPDYCAGVPGSPNTYIEPYFTWGDVMYVRGRVYFSILDQTATKAGNCGGVWSFIPSQNIDPSQDVGLALRLENQNSYGTYNGYANILIPNEEQQAVAPQYWSVWQNSYNDATASFGIDQTNSVPVTQSVIETDLVATGTMLDKVTFSQVEYKLATPLATSDSVELFWRQNGTAAWTSAGTPEQETDNLLSGYCKVNFQKTQWTQLRAIITTGGTAASSFVPLTELRLR